MEQHKNIKLFHLASWESDTWAWTRRIPIESHWSKQLWNTSIFNWRPAESKTLRKFLCDLTLEGCWFPIQDGEPQLCDSKSKLFQINQVLRLNITIFTITITFVWITIFMNNNNKHMINHEQPLIPIKIPTISYSNYLIHGYTMFNHPLKHPFC